MVHIGRIIDDLAEVVNHFFQSGLTTDAKSEILCDEDFSKKGFVMGKIVSRKFKISKAGPAGVAGAAEFIRRQSSGGNNVAAHAFARLGSGGGAGGVETGGGGRAGDGGGPPPPGGPFPVNAVFFDGTNDFLSRDAQLTGVTDSDSILLSLWWKIAGADGSNNMFHSTQGTQVVAKRNANNKIQFSCFSIPLGPRWNVETVTAYDLINNPGWHHLLVAAQFDATPVGQLFIDDVEASLTTFTALNEGLIDWTDSDYFVGATAAGAQKMNGDLSEVYVTDEFLDISIEANRRKFIDANGFPVDLGSDGSTPTGTAALEFFSGSTDAWHTNKGSGGGHTENGALTDAASSPSD